MMLFWTNSNVFLSGITNYPGRLSPSISFASALLRTDSPSVMRQSGGSTYTLVFNFRHFFSLKVMGSTYMQIAL